MDQDLLTADAEALVAGAAAAMGSRKRLGSLSDVVCFGRRYWLAGILTEDPGSGLALSNLVSIGA